MNRSIAIVASLSALGAAACQSTPAVPAASRPAGVEFTRPTAADVPSGAATAGEAGGTDWRHVVTLYGWVPGVEGTFNVRGVDADVDITRSDVLDNTDLAFAGRYEVQPPDSDWSFYADIFHARLGADESAATRLGPIDADAEVRLTFIEAGAVLHCWESEATTSAAGRATSQTKMDVFGGARWTRMRGQLDVNAPAIGRGFDVDETRDWTDPIVGARLRQSLAPRLWFVARGDIGGFDVGSHRTWSATGTFQYVVSETVAIGAGWRVLDIDENDDLDADIQLSGPFVGLSVEF